MRGRRKRTKEYEDEKRVEKLKGRGWRGEGGRERGWQSMRGRRG